MNLVDANVFLNTYNQSTGRHGHRPLPETKLEDVAGFLKVKGRPKSLREMDAGVAREVQRRHESGRY